MPSYGGAVEAVKDRLKANWATTPICFMNDTPCATQDANGIPIPWALGEIKGTGNELHATGTPGLRTWIQNFMLWVHVFAPTQSGEQLPRTYAEQIGEIFRAKAFYNDTPGFRVCTMTPSVDGGDSGSDDGLWFRVSMNIEGQYWHLA